MIDAADLDRIVGGLLVLGVLTSLVAFVGFMAWLSSTGQSKPAFRLAVGTGVVAGVFFVAALTVWAIRHIRVV